MEAATVKQGRGGGAPGPGSNGGRVVRAAERLQHLPHLLVAAAPSSFSEPGAEALAPV